MIWESLALLCGVALSMAWWPCGGCASEAENVSEDECTSCNDFTPLWYDVTVGAATYRAVQTGGILPCEHTITLDPEVEGANLLIVTLESGPFYRISVIFRQTDPFANKAQSNLVFGEAGWPYACGGEKSISKVTGGAEWPATITIST
jgi:hypothetical protein